MVRFINTLISCALIAGTCGAGELYAHSFGGSTSASIPERGFSETVFIEVPLDALVTDLNVTATIRHPSIFDLQIFLKSPAGTRIPLVAYEDMDLFFRGADYFNTTFDDEAPLTIEQGRAPFSDSFQPKYALSCFDGESMLGTWQFEVYDALPGDSGTIEQVILAFETSSTPEPTTLLLMLLGIFALRKTR